MNLTAAHTVQLDIDRALTFAGRRLRLLKPGQPKGYTVIAEVLKAWCLYEADEDDPLNIKIGELFPLTREMLRETVALAVDEDVYEINNKIEPKLDLNRTWICHVSLLRKERVPLES